MQALTIGKAARQAQVGIDTVRFYERQGLLPAASRTASGYRLYTADDVDRLRFIRRAKTLGFSLDEIAELLRLNAGKGTRGSVRKLAQRRLEDLERKDRRAWRDPRCAGAARQALHGGGTGDRMSDHRGCAGDSEALQGTLT